MKNRHTEEWSIILPAGTLRYVTSSPGPEYPFLVVLPTRPFLLAVEVLICGESWATKNLTEAGARFGVATEAEIRVMTHYGPGDE